MDLTSRLFLCARCRTQVVICSRCDRGQLYCSNHCSKTARYTALRTAGQRYQQSRQGRFKHAERARRYRGRQQKVTHQGSALSTADDVLSANSAPVSLRESVPSPANHHHSQCHFCGRGCSAFVRYRFLHRRRVPNIKPFDRRGAQHDHSP